MFGAGEVVEVALNFKVSTLFVTFLVILLGLLFGSLRIKKLGFGSSGVLLVAIVVGYFYDVKPIVELQSLGIVLFLWGVGLEAGPKFFRTFKRFGKKYIVMVLFLLTIAGSTAFGVTYLWSIPLDIALGLFTGAMTSTPGLVSATQVASDKGFVLMGYGIAYPIGLIGVILFVHITLKIFNKKIKKEKEKEVESKIHMMIYRLENKEYHKKLINETDVFDENEVLITGIKRDNILMLGSPKTALIVNDLIRIEGTYENVESVGKIIGKKIDTSFTNSHDLDTRQIHIENIKNINKSLRDLGIRMRFNVTITKVVRNVFEMYPKPDLVIEYGDIVHAIGSTEQLDELELFLGHIHHTVQPRVDILSLAGMLFFSFFIGGLVLPLGKLGEISLGIAGGALITGLVFGHFGRIGNFIGRFPTNAIKVLREFGVSLFFAQVGLKAGHALIDAMTIETLYFLLYASIMMIVPMVSSFIFGYFILRLSLSECYGVISGGMTCTPALQVIREAYNSDNPVIAYSSVYPLALILMILIIQIINYVLC